MGAQSSIIWQMGSNKIEIMTHKSMNFELLNNHQSSVSKSTDQ